jgi:hypothetical protein
MSEIPLTRTKLAKKLGCHGDEITFAIEAGYVFNCGNATTYRHYIQWRVDHPEFDPAEVRRSKLRTRELTYRRGNVQARLRLALSNRLRILLRRTGIPKTESVLDFIGCELSALKTHLESQFRDGMTWQNHGPVWHIDHKRPCARFNLADPEEQRACFNYTNLQPLFALENLRKGAS